MVMITSWQKKTVRMLIIAFGLYLIPCILLTIFQRDLLYHPPLVNPAVYERMGLQAGMVRWQNGLRLFTGYDGVKKLWEFPGADHGDVFEHFGEKWPEIKTFWDLSLPPPESPAAN
jgi:hypothetical protein